MSVYSTDNPTQFYTDPAQRNRQETGPVTPVTLAEIQGAMVREGLMIPAGKDRVPVRILPRAGYLAQDHGLETFQQVMDYREPQPGRRLPPVIIGVHLFGVGENAGEVRMLRLPVQVGNNLAIDTSITRDLMQAGFTQLEIDRLANAQRSRVLDPNAGFKFAHLRTALQNGNFVTEGNLEGRVQSGWSQNAEPALAVISGDSRNPWGAKFAMWEEDSTVRGKFVSQSLTEQGIQALPPDVHTWLAQMVR